MNTRSEMAIVIPAKSAKRIPRSLNSLMISFYPKMPNTKILVADAGCLGNARSGDSCAN